ncbi:MAG: hypothetical protein MJ188_05425 [Treponema sp.]|nr:hypothetical protein [Treponema sp.]
MKKGLLVILVSLFTVFTFANIFDDLDYDDDFDYEFDNFDEDLDDSWESFELDDEQDNGKKFFKGDSKSYKNFMDKGFVVKLNADYEYSSWIPDQASMLDYVTVGLPLAKYEAVLYTRFLPEIKLNYETSFGKRPQKMLLKQYAMNDGLGEYYNKMKIVVGIADIFHLFNTHYDYFNPWRSSADIKLSYSREAFRIGVTPKYSDLKFCDEDGTLSSMPVGKTLFQYSKFDEIDLDFSTNGKLFLPYIYSLLFNRDGVEGKIETDMETSFGLYTSWFSKPYSVTQTMGAQTTGKTNVIYNANFYSAGFVEKMCYAGDIFYFNMTMNMGLAAVMLSNSTILLDSNSLAFMQFNLFPEVGFHLPILNHRLIFSAYVSGNWGFLYGVNFNSDTDDDSILEFTSFINGDLIIKGAASITILL